MKVMLAKKYSRRSEVAGWWMSEKLDGVRAVWDGKNLVSRRGKVFNAPAWFVADLPKDVVLDGELWEGRGCFQATVGKIRARAGDWSGIQYKVFDVVTAGVFGDRMEQLATLPLPDHCRLGALVCEYMGKLFKLGAGLTDEIRDTPPPIGSVVTFTYFDATRAGIPRFASFCAVRDYE